MSRPRTFEHTHHYVKHSTLDYMLACQECGAAIPVSLKQAALNAGATVDDTVTLDRAKLRHNRGGK